MEIKKIRKGDSLTLRIRFNPEYDQTNLLDLKVFANSKKIKRQL